MKKIRQTLLGLGLASALQAAPILDFQDTFDPADVKLTSDCGKSYSFTHNILDDGFLPSGHAIQYASLRLTLADDGDPDFLFWIIPLAPEFGAVIGDGVLLSPYLFEVDGGTHPFNVSPALLQEDGKLKVTVKALYGDYYFKSSRLDVYAVAAVPEPGTTALMGLGLLALGLAAKRRKMA